MKHSYEPKRKYDIFSLLGWISGGLSLLNLIEDLTPLKLFGKLEKWVQAYSLFIEKISDFLFGWINLQWINISPLEAHLLVITFVVVGAYFRVEFKAQRGHGESIASDLFISLGPVMTDFFLLALLPALLLPTWFGIAGATIGFVYICWYYLWPDSMGYCAYSRALYKELVGALIVLMLLVILNYTVFR
ncbi:MAG: hypothetical protein ACK6AD_06920 [Cyanobacteriota bacterium]|jgi:hypothetical protein